MERINLLGFTPDDMENIVSELGEKKFKGRQLFQWLYQSSPVDFDRMTNLSLALRKTLAERFQFAGPTLEKASLSSDGTEKYLLRLADEKFIETVLIPDRDKSTVCVSSQVGCPLGCRFCATATLGFDRNLTTGEIVGQLLFLRDRHGPDSIDNVVFMGMGEPLLNLPNVMRAVEIISSELGLALSARRITISTIGLAPQIYQLADSDLKVNLAISLHAATDDKRRQIMPAVRAHPLEELLRAAKYFANKRKKRVTLEYIVFKDFNDTEADIKELARVVQGIPCKINILAYNPVGGLPYRRPSDDEIDHFARLLYPRAPAVTVRRSRGLDIEAACGQLAGKNKVKNNNNGDINHV